MDHTSLYIDGVWREGAAGQRFDVINPATEACSPPSPRPRSPTPTPPSTRPKPRFPSAGRTLRQRSEVLRKLFELMSARLPEFARLITLENGKPRADAMGEAIYAAEFFRWFA